MAPGTADFDLVVIGGGINGAAIARDAALRGLSVLLLEKGDFGGGTTSYSSRLIHGGLRYLEYAEFPLVFESLRERRRLLQLAPHLVRQLCISIPVYKHSRRGMWLVRLGMFIYALLSIGKVVPRHRILSRSAMIAEMPGLSTDNLQGGAQYYDAQVTFAERLVIENIVSAAEAGAVVKNYSPVIGLVVQGGRLRYIHYVDHASGEEREVCATVVVNAAGPWVDRVLATVNRELPLYMGGTKGSHIVVPIFAGAPKSAVYAEAGSDGRPFFIIPWNRQFLIGTTDIRYSGDPDDATASHAEINYLLTETNRLFPQAKLGRKDIHFTYSGVRPLPKRASGPESAITRKHIIKKHRIRARGLVSVIGGKLTTYRNLAEQMVDYVNKKTGMKGSNCETQTRSLPGATGIEEAREILEKFGGLSAEGKQRLLGIYGGKAKQLLELAQSGNKFSAPLNPEKSILAAEIYYVIKFEKAVTLVDIIYRRMMLGWSADQGIDLVDPIAGVAAAHFNWSNHERKSQVQALHHYRSKFLVNT
jgi:glycerol-3-phosphate dehydrogenase